jgi:hypothetical protein
VCFRVDSARQTADDGRPCAHQLLADRPRHLTAVVARLARSHDRDGESIGRQDLAAHEEKHWRVVDVAQRFRIALVRPRHQPSVDRVEPRDLPLDLTPCVETADRLDDIRPHSGTDQRVLPRPHHRRRAAEGADQLQPNDVADPAHHAQSQPRRPRG